MATTQRRFSIEDGDLNVRTLYSSRDTSYSDLDLAFEENSIGDVYKKLDAAAVKQAVKNIVLCNYGEKPFQPFFGTDIRNMLFELFDFGTSEDIKRRIQLAIDLYEPRARIREIFVSAEDEVNSLSVEIIFEVINTSEVVTLVTSISRLR